MVLVFNGLLMLVMSRRDDVLNCWVSLVLVRMSFWIVGRFVLMMVCLLKKWCDRLNRCIESSCL